MKQKNPDNLDMDVRRAQLLGYGIHYGRYKADHPNTKCENTESHESQEESKFRVCPVCGNRFKIVKQHGRKRYCSDECYREQCRRLKTKRYYEMKSRKGGIEEKC